MYNLTYKLMFSTSTSVINQMYADFLTWIRFWASLQVDKPWAFNTYELLNTGFFNLLIFISLPHYFYRKVLRFLILNYMKYWLNP